MNQRFWTQEEDNYIKNNFQNITFRKMAQHLGCAPCTVEKRAVFLGLNVKKRNVKRWTPEEEQILTQLSSKFYIREIAKVLNRTEMAVISKANKMGLDYITLDRKYRQEELDYIRSNWGIIPISVMARTLKVSRIMIQRQADLMNLPKLGNNSYCKWTDEKIEKLRKLAKEKTITELAKYFKTTNEAIQTVACRNCVDLIDEKIHWTKEDNLILRECAKTMDVSEIAVKMNRSINAVRLQVQRQGITVLKNKKYQDSIWTEEDSEKLRELVKQNKTLLEIAKIMNKKDETLLKKAREMNLEILREKYRFWTEEDNQKLIDLSKTRKLSELVKELGRTSSSIKRQAIKLGIIIIADRKNWTKEELEKLGHLVVVEKKTTKEIAEILERTEDSIINKINRIGLKIQSNDKRFWNAEEETMLSDLWGSEPIEKIAKKLNRTVSSVRNRSFQLGLGSQIESNYDGLKIKDICDLFNVRVEAVNIYWVALGLKCKVRQITKAKSYRYVEIEDLYKFLEANQNIWDSRSLEKNILGIEPEWLRAKRKFDSNMPLGYFGLGNLTKQQLIVAKQFFLEHQQSEIISQAHTDQEDLSFESDKQQLEGFSKKISKRKEK